MKMLTQLVSSKLIITAHFLFLGLLNQFGTVSAQPLAVIEDTPNGPGYLAAQVLVQFKPGASDAALLDAVRTGQLEVNRYIQTPAMRRGNHLGLPLMWTRLPVRQAIAALRNHPAVEFAEPNWVYSHQATSNDPYFSNGGLWGMYGDATTPANVYGSQAAEAWAAGYTGSSSVIVGVIDEGIQVDHPDLTANIWSNPFDPADGSDNDGNGYVDDLHGWDFFENNNSVYDGTGDDHAVHVAGTIGAVGGNGFGVAGVNWSVTMISGKFLGPNGGSTADAVEAVDYFTDLKARHKINLVALNNSWGGGGYSQALHDAIIRAAKAGLLFIAAAGNGNRVGKAVNNDSTPFYPASYNTAVGTSTESAASFDSVISVTAINSTGGRANWANYGATTVDLGAPGVSINSTLPPNSFGSYSGTSMATPHVTGAIALYASTHPDATAAEMKEAILNATIPTASLAGRTVTGGRLDLSTVIAPATPADPPPAVSIILPINNSTISETVTVTATARDNSAVAKVEFFVDGILLGEGIAVAGTDEWSISWDTTKSSPGTHLITANATDDGGHTGTSSPVTVNVNNPLPATLHCGDLDATRSSAGSTWQAHVTVSIHDANHTALTGALVQGRWSGGLSATKSAYTGPNGTVTFATGPIAKRNGSVTFEIIEVISGGLDYHSAANHDPDGESNGTRITVQKP